MHVNVCNSKDCDDQNIVQAVCGVFCDLKMSL